MNIKSIDKMLYELGQQYDETASFIEQTDNYIQSCINSPRGIKGRKKAILDAKETIVKLKALEKTIMTIAELERTKVEEKELKQIHRMATNLTKQTKNIQKEVQKVRSFRMLGYINLKGGIGKTSLTYTTATFLSKYKNKKILIIDLDHQGNSTAAFDPTATKINRTNTKRLFEYNIEAPDLIESSPFKNIDVIGSGHTLIDTELNLTQRTGREFILKNWIHNNIEYLNKSYDYIFFDFSPNFNQLNINGLVVVDSVILISEPNRFSLESIQQFQKLYTRIIRTLIDHKKKFAFLINKADKTTIKSRNFIELMKSNEEYKDLLLETVIHKATELQYALEDTRVISEKKNKNLFQEYEGHINDLEKRDIL